MYTYLIGWTKHNKWYYGVRYAKGCYPEDLWTKYFTSSKHVKQFRQKYGEPDIIQIRKMFDNKEKAILWEHKVLKKLKVNLNNKWLNKTYNGCYTFKGIKNTIPGMLAALKKIKGKTYEELYSKEICIKLKHKSSMTSKNNWANPELAKRMSNKRLNNKETTNYKQAALKSWKNKEIAYKRNNHKFGQKPKVLCCFCCKKEMSKLGFRNHLKYKEV